MPHKQMRSVKGEDSNWRDSSISGVNSKYRNAETAALHSQGGQLSKLPESNRKAKRRMRVVAQVRRARGR
jgi:hypothetical protein